MEVTPYSIAERFIGIEEIPGQSDNPQILAMLKLDDPWPQHDEVPWCASFVNYVFWLLRLPRTKTKLARDWEHIGERIPLTSACRGHDIVVLTRGSNPKYGHVGFYSGSDQSEVFLLGGNQSNSVNVSGYNQNRIVAVNRIR